MTIADNLAVAWAAGAEGACRHARCQRDGARRLDCLAGRFGAEIVVASFESSGLHALTLALPGRASRVLVSDRLRPDLARGFAYHALGHVLLDDRAVCACSYADGDLRCVPAWRASLALAVPLSALDRPREQAASELGLPALWLDKTDLAARQHGARPGGATREEIAQSWLDTVRWVKWMVASPRLHGRRRAP